MFEWLFRKKHNWVSANEPSTWRSSRVWPNGWTTWRLEHEEVDLLQEGNRRWVKTYIGFNPRFRYNPTRIALQAPTVIPQAHV